VNRQGRNLVRLNRATYGMTRSNEAAFHCTRYDASIIDRPLPGRELAAELSAALVKLGHTPVGVFDEEPFWAVRVPLGSGTTDVLVFVHSPDSDRAKAVWCLSVNLKTSFLDRLRGKKEDASTVPLLNALHEALLSLPHVQDIRWFKELPSDPYDSASWAERPTV
jgi:hypothetical protein